MKYHLQMYELLNELMEKIQTIKAIYKTNNWKIFEGNVEIYAEKYEKRKSISVKDVLWLTIILSGMQDLIYCNVNNYKKIRVLHDDIIDIIANIKNNIVVKYFSP